MAQIDFRPAQSAPPKIDFRPAGSDRAILDVFDPPETPAKIDFHPAQAAPKIDFHPAQAAPKIDFMPQKDTGLVAKIGASEAGQSLASAGKSAINFLTMKKLPTPALDALKAKKAAGQPVGVRDYVGVFNEGFQNSPGGQAMNAVFGSLGAPLAPTVGAITRGGEKLGIPPEYMDLAMELAPALGIKGKESLPVKAADAATGAMDKAAQPLRKAFSPATVSKDAARAAMVKRQTLGEATRDLKADVEKLAPYEKRFDKLTPEEQKLFPMYMENYSFIKGDEKIASAAKRDEDGNIKTGTKHAAIPGEGEEGFVTTTGRFVNRKQADYIARAQDQLVQKEAVPGELHSEDIGRPKLPPDLQQAAEFLRQGYKLREEKLKNTKSLKDTGLIQDYLNRNAVFPSPKSQAAFDRIIFGKQGRGGNLRTRKYPSFEEFQQAVHEAGGRLRDPNFMRSAAGYFADMDMYIAHARAFDQLRDDKLVKYSPNPRAVPEGWAPLQGRYAEKIAQTKSGAITRQRAYAPADVARVYNNFLSKDVGGELGDTIRRTRHVLNAITAAKLGLLKVWHAGIVSTGAVSRDLVKGTRQLLTPGKRLKGAVSTVLSPLAPIRLAWEGRKYHKQYLKLTDDPQAEKLVKLATKANLIQTRRPGYMNVIGRKRYEDFFSPTRLVGLDAQARGVGARVGRALQAIGSPMFDMWIPAIKTGATLERLQLWLEQHPDATPKEQEAYAVSLGNSIDNNFGEMNQNNLFWHRALLNGLNAGFLSIGWIAGAGRMVSGAAKELHATIRHGAELGPNAEYLMANAVVAGILSTIYQYAHTGQMPQNAEDLMWPQSGGIQHIGTRTVPEHVTLPSGHWNQFAEYLHDPLQELSNEGNPGAKLFWDLLNNKDYRTLPIAKPWALWSDDWLKEAGDALWRYAGFITQNGVTPISVSTFMNRQEGTGIKPWETIGLAARPAPGIISGPEAVEGYNKYFTGEDWKKKIKSDRRLENRRLNKYPAFMEPPQ